MENGHLKGIGGWLILVLIGLIISLISVAGTLTDTMNLYKPEVWHTITTYGSEAYHPLFGTWIIYETALNIFVIIFTICLLILMFRKSRLFPKLMIFYFVSAVFLQGIDYYLSYIVLTDLPNVSKALGVSPSLEGVMRSAVQGAVWVPYFIRSKRVKATFINKESNTNPQNQPIINDI
jgi:hypothetical protein